MHELTLIWLFNTIIMDRTSTLSALIMRLGQADRTWFRLDPLDADGWLMDRQLAQSCWSGHVDSSVRPFSILLKLDVNPLIKILH